MNRERGVIPKYKHQYRPPRWHSTQWRSTNVPSKFTLMDIEYFALRRTRVKSIGLPQRRAGSAEFEIQVI